MKLQLAIAVLLAARCVRAQNSFWRQAGVIGRNMGSKLPCMRSAPMEKRQPWIIWALKILIWSSATLTLADDQTKIRNLLADSSHIGLPPAAIVPKFQLKDQSGHERDFESLKGPRGLVLVFFRSADW